MILIFHIWSFLIWKINHIWNFQFIYEIKSYMILKNWYMNYKNKHFICDFFSYMEISYNEIAKSYIKCYMNLVVCEASTWCGWQRCLTRRRWRSKMQSWCHVSSLYLTICGGVHEPAVEIQICSGEVTVYLSFNTLSTSIDGVGMGCLRSINLLEPGSSGHEYCPRRNCYKQEVS